MSLLATDKSRYFAQPRPIIANYFSFLFSVIQLACKSDREFRAAELCELLPDAHSVSNEVLLVENIQSCYTGTGAMFLLKETLVLRRGRLRERDFFNTK